MAKRNRKQERATNTRKLANNYARAFNGVAERAGIDIPMPLCVKLVELFYDAMETGAALEKDYGSPQSADAVARGVDSSTSRPRA